MTIDYSHDRHAITDLLLGDVEIWDVETNTYHHGYINGGDIRCLTEEIVDYLKERDLEEAP